MGGDARTQDLIRTVADISNGLMNEVSKVIIGKNENLRRVTVGILSNGNMLLEDFPGLAKTLLANTFARALGCKFKRVQFTPDLLPSDIMGTYMYDQKSGEFKLRAGPLFSNILLADEINRAPPKTQAALLEAMEEKQVTIEGITHKLPAPFVVLATQNPIEQEGTYPLPEAQMDRFLMKMSMGYPDRAEEKAILARRKLRGKINTTLTKSLHRRRSLLCRKLWRLFMLTLLSLRTSLRLYNEPVKTTASSTAHRHVHLNRCSRPAVQQLQSLDETTSFLMISRALHCKSSATVSS
jgi:MoxR-like ATPase